MELNVVFKWGYGKFVIVVEFGFNENRMRCDWI